jgi:hypothetical protein
LQLHAFEGIVDINLETAQLLVRMPTLQRVEPYRVTPDALRLLAHSLPDLHTLTVYLDEATPESGWAVVRDGLAACHQLTALTLEWTPVKQLAALLLVLPPSVRKLDIVCCDGFLQSDAVLLCVAEGGLRQLERLHVRLQWHEYDEQKVAEWSTRQRACAPWIAAVVREA